MVENNYQIKVLPIARNDLEEIYQYISEELFAEAAAKSMFRPSETGIIRENLVDANHDQAIELYYEKYREMHRELVLDNEKINDLLLQLRDKGYKLGIVTGKARRSLLISLECLNMSDLFDVIITGDDVDTPKPHPEGINKALEHLNVKNNEAIF